MTVRLPVPGQDDGIWGSLLNDFLSQSLAADGSVRPNAVADKAPLASPTFSGTVTVPAPASPSAAATKSYVDSVLTVVADATTSSKGIVQLAGDLAGTAASPVIANGAVTSAKIADGTITTADISATANIAASQMASTVRTSLGKADTAQQVADVDAKIAAAAYSDEQAQDAAAALFSAGTMSGISFAYNDASNRMDVTVTPGSVADATATVKGAVQLAGDLTGTAAAPALTTVITAGSIGSATAVPIISYDAKGRITAASSAVASDTTRLSKGANLSDLASVATAKTNLSLLKADVGLANVDNTADSAKPISTAQASALATKAPLASPTFSGTVTVPTPTSATDATTKGYVDSLVANGAADATSTTKGIIQLAGDLTGSAAAPALAAVITAGSVGAATSVPVIGYDAKGRITSVTTAAASDTSRLAISANLSDLGSVATAKTNLSLLKADVGLANVDNTADSAKPVSTAQAAAIAAKASTLTTQSASTASSGTLSADTVNPIDATSATATRTLPTPTATGQIIVVEKVDTTVNTVVISGTVRGASASVTLYWQYESIEFVAESLISWRPIAGHKTKTALDTAYLNVLGTPSNPVTSASAARPSGLTRVYWLCATQPTNWISGDEWINNA